MNREEIITIVNEFLTEELEIDANLLKDDARLKEDLKIDSLDFVDIAVIVERHFKIKIKPEDMKKLFAKFERIEEQRNRRIEGTGLGMSITESLLEMMGSKLEVVGCS